MYLYLVTLAFDWIEYNQSTFEFVTHLYFPTNKKHTQTLLIQLTNWIDLIDKLGEK